MTKGAKWSDLALVIAVTLAGCNRSPTGPALELRTRTVGRAFMLREGSASVPFALTNVSDGRAYYVTACNHHVSVMVERREGDDWVQTADPGCAADLSISPIRLDPGSRIEATVGIDSPGVFRLRLGVSRSAAVLGEWVETSNRFTVLIQ